MKKTLATFITEQAYACENYPAPTSNLELRLRTSLPLQSSIFISLNPENYRVGTITPSGKNRHPANPAHQILETPEVPSLMYVWNSAFALRYIPSFSDTTRNCDP